MTDKAITIEALVNAPVDKVWAYWTEPAHVTKWNFASDDWHSPHAENDLTPGGKFKIRMEARDGSMGFDFEGINSVVEKEQRLEYALGDGRSVAIDFIKDGDRTKVTETFDPEGVNPLEMQRMGWQMILNNFKKYAESN